MSHGLFAIERHDDGVALLCISTHEAPYMDAAWVDGFSAALGPLGTDPSVRVIILEGDGPYFSAGASRDALLESVTRQSRLTHVARAARDLLACPLPIISAAAGHAVGGGLLVALWSDVILLAEESLYGASFMRLGFTPGMGATYAVREAFGEPLGRELLLSGRLLTGREIRQACCPLSHAVRPRADVAEQARSIARQIAEAPRESIVLLKRNLATRRGEALEGALRLEEDAHERLFTNPDTLAELARRYSTPSAAMTREEP